MATNFYATPRLTTISFAAGILLFLLPFAEIRCNGASFAQISGLNMVTGSAPKMSNDLEGLTQSFGRYDNSTIKTEKNKGEGKVYAFAVIAVLLGIGGLAVSLLKKKTHDPLELLLGAVGAAALIALMIQVKADVNSQLKSGNENAEDLGGMMKVSIDFTAWFFLCVASYLASAFFSYKQKELVTAGDIPPKDAPQVPINNPGDQSDFPAGPSGEKDLG